MSVFGHMREDIETVIKKDPASDSALQVFLFSEGLHAIWAYRRAHWLWAHGFTRLATWLSTRSHKRYGIDIHPAATIGRRFMIDHGVGIVVGATAIVGDDCLFYHGVTLGMTGKHAGKRHPTLGSDVMVGAGATILGNIQIGDRVKVAAGAVVLHDVPADTTVAGVPAKVVRKRSCPMLEHLEIPNYDDENIRWSCQL